MQHHEVVSRDEWLVARKELLTKEKELTRLRDQLSQERRALPWEKVEKEYVFDGPNGNETLADLFEGRSQLSFLTSCTDRTGRKAVPVVHSGPTTTTA